MENDSGAFRMKKFYVFFIGICLLAGTAWAQQTQQQIQGFNLQGYSDEGEKQWDVKGDTADVSGGEIKISNVDANSYGETKMNVTAQTGFINQTDGKMRLEKDVIITSEEGSRMMTDSLDWDKQKDLVSTPDDVTITDDRMTVMGKGMEAKPGLKQAKVQEDVTVRVNTKPQEMDNQVVTITSDGPMEIDHANAFATFKDQVVVMHEGKILNADYMEVHFDKEMKGIREIICLGNVVITQGENRTVADKAIYNAQTQRMTLSGRPKLIFLTEGTDAASPFGN